MTSLLQKFASIHRHGFVQRSNSLPLTSLAANVFNVSCGNYANTLLNILGVRHASKKAAGSSKNSSDSGGKRLGLKHFGSAFVKPGSILIRQRGTRFHPGANVILGRDHTISAKVAGYVKFTYMRRPFRRKNRVRKFVNIVPDGSDGADVIQWNQDNEKKYLLTLMIKKKKLHYKTVDDLQAQQAKQVLIDQGEVPRLQGEWKDLIRKEENRGKAKERYVPHNFERPKNFRPKKHRVIGIVDNRERHKANTRRL